MQSTGQTSTHAVSFVAMHGSQMIYAIVKAGTRPDMHTYDTRDMAGLKGPACLVAALLSCNPALTALFTPRHAQTGQYEVCTTPEPLSDVARAGWTVGAPEDASPLDAFGAAGSYDRSALARLYGGTRPRLIRGW